MPPPQLWAQCLILGGGFVVAHGSPKAPRLSALPTATKGAEAAATWVGANTVRGAVDGVSEIWSWVCPKNEGDLPGNDPLEEGK